MSFCSNRILYLINRYTFPLIGIVFICSSIVTILDAKYLLSSFLVIASAVSIGRYYLFAIRVVEVEIDENNIVITGKMIVKWSDVAHIELTWGGLYRLEIKKQKEQLVYYFPTYDLPIQIFGTKLFDDEFDNLIDRKKKQYQI